MVIFNIIKLVKVYFINFFEYFMLDYICVVIEVESVYMQFFNILRCSLLHLKIVLSGLSTLLDGIIFGTNRKV